MRREGLLRAETRPGDALTVSGRVVTPVARSWRLALPFGGLVWNRPLGILVRDENGQRLVRVRDRTRWIEALLVGAGLASAWFLWRDSRRGAD